MGCSPLKRPVDTHRTIFRACPACSELEPSLILGELEAGVKRQGEEKKECVPGATSAGLSAVSCLGVGGWGGLALQVIKSFLYHRDPPSHQDVRWLGE